MGDFPEHVKQMDTKQQTSIEHFFGATPAGPVISYPNVSPNLSSCSCLAPGIVLLKGALSREQQIYLAQYACKEGHVNEPGHASERNFWTIKDGQRVFNSAKGRGRIYDAISTFSEPDLIRSIATGLAEVAKKVDPTMPEFNPTHLLLLYYATNVGIGWHADSGANDGDNDHPIVSISLGNSAVFGIKIDGQTITKIPLESGDVIIWGGEQRMLKHSVLSCKPNTSPAYLKLPNARLNFTFRDAPNILGHESQFKFFYGGKSSSNPKDTN